MWILITIMMLLLFGFGYYLNWKGNRELKRLRRKYDEENGPNTKGVGGDAGGCGEAVISSEQGIGTEEPDRNNEGRRNLSDTEDSPNATDIPSPTADKPKPTDK